jgi:hypothetical protein
MADDTPPPAGLTPEQRQKIENWFKEKRAITGAVCPICNTKNWTTLPDLVTPIPLRGEGMVLGGTTYPHFVLVCNNCGNSQFINAVATGIVDPEKPKGSTS